MFMEYRLILDFFRHDRINETFRRFQYYLLLTFTVMTCFGDVGKRVYSVCEIPSDGTLIGTFKIFFYEILSSLSHTGILDPLFSITQVKCGFSPRDDNILYSNNLIRKRFRSRNVQ